MASQFIRFLNSIWIQVLRSCYLLCYSLKLSARCVSNPQMAPHELQQLVAELPIPNRNIICTLIRFFREVYISLPSLWFKTLWCLVAGSSFPPSQDKNEHQEFGYYFCAFVFAFRYLIVVASTGDHFYRPGHCSYWGCCTDGIYRKFI